MIIEVKDLVKKYGNNTVLKNISFNVDKGEIFGFIGHNGAGKTTTIKSIIGINNFDSGDILVDNISVKKDSLAVRKIIAYIPDNPDLYENLKGIEYLNFVADVFEVSSKDRKERIERYAKELEIFDDLSSIISSYSHGMKQKLAIISALIHDPKLLILDEPFVGLDPKAQYKLKELMKEKCNKGMSVFFSSHTLEVVEKLCDKIAIISKGKIVKLGDPKEIAKDSNLEDVFLKLMEE